MSFSSRSLAAIRERSSSVNRRQTMAILGGMALVGLGSPIAYARQATPATAAGEWSFTDDLGVTVTLPKQPLRIAADLKAAAPLRDFGIEPVAVSGWTVGTDTAWGSVDRSTPNITASAESSEPDIEQLLELQPDLFVTATWHLPGEPYSWSFPDEAIFERVNAMVPVIALSANGSALRNAERYAELAEALGADPEAAQLAEARASLDERLAALEETLAEGEKLTVLFISADGDAINVANPGPWAELSTYLDLGLDIVVPDVEPDAYWQELSTEEATRYPADIIFQSTRAGSLTPEELQEHPTYGRHPAIAAGQIAPWNQDSIHSYQGLAAALDTLVQALESAQKVTE